MELPAMIDYRARVRLTFTKKQSLLGADNQRSMVETREKSEEWWWRQVGCRYRAISFSFRAGHGFQHHKTCKGMEEEADRHAPFLILPVHIPITCKDENAHFFHHFYKLESNFVSIIVIRSYIFDFLQLLT
jgi:hypothetical protein